MSQRSTTHLRKKQYTEPEGNAHIGKPAIPRKAQSLARQVNCSVFTFIGFAVSWLVLVVSWRTITNPLSHADDADPPVLSAAVEFDEPRPSPYSLPYSRKSNNAEDTLKIFGTNITFCVKQHSVLKQIKGHVNREILAYAIVKDAITTAKTNNPSSERPLFLDVGSNHGIFALYAAHLGADVIALEPQTELCNLIVNSIQLNGLEDRVTLYNAALLDKHENITMETMFGDGGVGTVVRNSVQGLNPVEAFPLSAFLNSSETRRISFLKIDVEGFELQAMSSAGYLFETRRVDNVLVEFGPPSRWKNVMGEENVTAMGLKAMGSMHDRYGLSTHFLRSPVSNRAFNEYRRWNNIDNIREKVIPADSPEQQLAVIDAMEMKNFEASLWFILDKTVKYPTLEKY